LSTASKRHNASTPLFNRFPHHTFLKSASYVQRKTATLHRPL
jgi:hypothetical protein